MGLLDIFKQKDSVPEKVETCEKTDSGANMVKEIREEILQKTAIPYMKLQLTDTKPSLFDSKVGGIGYVPRDAKIPEDSEGVQLRLLAQIDCAEITLEDFPHQGLLQFWILNDDVSGLNFDDNTLQDTFRVLYFVEPDRTVTEKEVCEKVQDLSSDEEDYFPVRGCYGLAFSAGVDTISSSDYRFENCIKKLVRQDYSEKAESLLENIDDFMDETGKTGAAVTRSAVTLGLRNGILVEKVTPTICCCFSWTVTAITARTECCGATAALETSSLIGKN